MIKYLHIITFVTTIIFNTVLLYSQDDCVVRLQEAEILYNDGKIELIPDLITNCIESGFGKEQKIRAYRLLALVYLNEDNQILAEEYLLKLLKTDPEYKPNTSVDPLEYVRIYNSIETEPLFSVGGIGGFNYTYPGLIEPIGSNAFNEINANYSKNAIGISGGIRMVYHFSPKIDLALEPSFVSSNFKLSESVTDNELIQAEEVIRFIDIPVVGSYGIWNFKYAQLFAEAGMVFGIYTGGTLDITNTYINGSTPDYTESPYTTNTIRKRGSFSALAGISSKLRLNRSYLQMGLRYKYGLNNMVNTNANSDVVNRLQWVNRYRDNHFRLSSVYFYISYNYEFYRHIKK